MPSGWVRYIFERFEFPFEVVFPKTLDEGNLNGKYDVLVFMDGAIHAAGGCAQRDIRAASTREYSGRGSADVGPHH